MSKISVKSECATLVKWEIRNFSTIAARNDPEKRLISDDFQLDSSAIKCYLKFQPTTINGTDKNYSSFFLHVQDFAGQSYIELRWHFWIENELGEKIEECDTEQVFDNKPGKNSWGVPQFVHHDELYSADNQFVKNDVVFLCARIVRGDALPKLKTDFNRNLWSSYNKGLTGECTLLVSGEELKVSKTLLTAHSKVFKDMFTSGMKEQATGVVEITDVDAKTMKAFVEYLHTESVENLSEVALELFKCADKYMVDGLKAQCEESLIKSLSKDNLCDYLILAFMYKSEVLKTAVLDFIERSQDRIFASIMGSSDWIDFAGQNKELASEITAAVFEKLNFKH